MGSTREENLAAVRRYADAWQSGDVGAIVACYHDDLVLHWFGTSPLAGEHRGKAAAVQALARVQVLTNRRLLAIRDVLASDDHAILLTRERMERDGRVLECDRVLVFEIRDGQLAECWLYDEDQRAVDEMWR